jgi:hypothetical protein
MRTTIELPDEILTRVKTLSARSGISLRQFFAEAIEQKLTTNIEEAREVDINGEGNSDNSGSRTWQDFFELMNSINVPEDFMSERPMNVPPVDRDLFKG